MLFLRRAHSPFIYIYIYIYINLKYICIIYIGLSENDVNNRSKWILAVACKRCIYLNVQSTMKIGVERLNEEKSLLRFAGYITLAATNSMDKQIINRCSNYLFSLCLQLCIIYELFYLKISGIFVHLSMV